MWQLKGFVSIFHCWAALPTRHLESRSGRPREGLPDQVTVWRRRKRCALCRKACCKKKETGAEEPLFPDSDKKSFPFIKVATGPELA